MKKAIMSVLTVWIMVSSMFIGLISFSDIENVKAPYIPHDPIRINSNSEFASMAGSEGWAGNGLPGSPYIIEGYDINGSGYGYCIYIGNTTVYFKVKDSYLHEAIGGSGTFYHSNSGIILYIVQNGTITNNHVSSNFADGINLHSSSSNSITNNNSSSNNGQGIILTLSSNNTIVNNTASKNDHGVFLPSSSNNTITNNNVSSNRKTCLILLSSSGNIIANNTASSSYDDGIRLEFSNTNTITNNTASNNYQGIVLVWSSDNTVTNNAASLNNLSSIYLSHSNSNTVANNTASFNIDKGIRLYDSNSNTVVNNTSSSNNHYGIYLDKSNNNTIVNNTSSSNNWSGIYLKSSSNNTIANNTVSSNNLYGIWIMDSESLDNRIYHNNIINNTIQAYDETDNGNQWDNGYPPGGNFWSDYMSSDYFSGPNQDIPGSDGIGDTNYSIDSDSVDYYPLMSTSGPFIFLYPGWNLISIPFIQSDTNLVPVLSPINGSYDAVQWYNNSDTSDFWTHQQISKPSQLNELTDINHIIGFWIHIIEPDGVLYAYPGIPPTSNQPIPLHPGWNKVGYPSLTNRNRTAALNNLSFGVEVDSIWAFNAANKNWVEVIGGGYFEMGRGYWIHAKHECVWEVPL
jgi:parallel beta-helix repeat protein